MHTKQSRKTSKCASLIIVDDLNLGRAGETSMGAEPENSPARSDGIQLMVELERLFQSDPDIDEVALLPATGGLC